MYSNIKQKKAALQRVGNDTLTPSSTSSSSSWRPLCLLISSVSSKKRVPAAYIHPFLWLILKCYGPANLSLQINLFLMHRQFESASSEGANFVMALRSVLCFRTRVCQSAVTNDCLRHGPNRSDMARERAEQRDCSSLCYSNAVNALHYHPVHIFTPYSLKLMLVLYPPLHLGPLVFHPLALVTKKLKLSSSLIN